MSKRIPPKGVYVPVPTFFQPENESLQAKLDLDSQLRHGVSLARAGITGLVLLGSTGEAIHLSRQERRELVKHMKGGLADAGLPDYPIMAGVLTNGVDETLEWLHDYAEAGAQWGLVLVPGYFGSAATQDDIRAWFELVADHSPIPILIYNYPAVTNNVTVQPDTYAALARHENMVGCKMTHGNVSHHVQVALHPAIDHESFRVYSGLGQHLAPVVLFGAAGVIDAMAALYPKTVTRLMELATGGDTTAAAASEMRRLQYVVSKSEEFVGRHGVVGVREAVCRLTGLGTLACGRLPLMGRLSDGLWEKERAMLLADMDKTEAGL